MPGPTQLLILLVIILILFGGKKLPDFAHSLGKSLGEFKKGKEEGDRETSAKSDATPGTELHESKDDASPTKKA